MPPRGRAPDDRRPPGGGDRARLGPRVRRQAAQLGVGAGEALEVLQRLPAAAVAGQGRGPRGPVAPFAGDDAARATRALDAYAARKRAVARLARQGRL